MQVLNSTFLNNTVISPHYYPPSISGQSSKCAQVHCASKHPYALYFPACALHHWMPLAVKRQGMHRQHAPCRLVSRPCDMCSAGKRAAHELQGQPGTLCLHTCAATCASHMLTSAGR
jgi:hypothetical protein